MLKKILAALKAVIITLQNLVKEIEEEEVEKAEAAEAVEVVVAGPKEETVGTVGTKAGEPTAGVGMEEKENVEEVKDEKVEEKAAIEAGAPPAPAEAITEDDVEEGAGPALTGEPVPAETEETTKKKAEAEKAPAEDKEEPIYIGPAVATEPEKPRVETAEKKEQGKQGGGQGGTASPAPRLKQGRRWLWLLLGILVALFLLFWIFSGEDEKRQEAVKPPVPAKVEVVKVSPSLDTPVDTAKDELCAKELVYISNGAYSLDSAIKRCRAAEK